MADYVLITPAKNEAKNIAKTIQSVLSQDCKPAEWIIVSDGSTDDTDDIVLSFCQKSSFLKLCRRESSRLRSYSSKVETFNYGLKCLSCKTYSFIGNLDADVSFSSDYFSKLLFRFDLNNKLGIAGGRIHEIHNGKTMPVLNSQNSVAGALQLFRKECFEQIGGLLPISSGGEDSAAEISARACGWDVRHFDDLVVLHHGLVLSGKPNLLMKNYQTGYNRYLLGYHPLFHVISSIPRLIRRPYLLGALYFLIGYFKAAVKRIDKKLSQNIIEYLRKEQIKRILNALNIKNNY